MLTTLSKILSDNWNWRKQIGRLSVFELVKKSRGAVLGWTWFLIKPAMYIFCFWFALEMGLRQGDSTSSEAPYILWLCSGIIPWFFMQDILGTGTDVLHRYTYLVNKIKFPLSAISTIFTLATMIIQLFLMVILFGVYLLCGMPIDIYLIQVPILLFLMFVFWDMVSIGFSELSAVSKDVSNLIQALTTPVFWLSGVIFSVTTISVPWIQAILNYNPVTFFVSSFRAAFYDKVWFWENSGLCLGFGIVFVATLIFMLFVYKKLNKEVADVL